MKDEILQWILDNGFNIINCGNTEVRFKTLDNVEGIYNFNTNKLIISNIVARLYSGYIDSIATLNTIFKSLHIN